MNLKTIISFFFKMLAIAMVIAVLLPSAVKLSHIFNHHKHQVCTTDGIEDTSHFHSIDLECDFYKFKINNTYFSKTDNFESFIIPVYAELKISKYTFFKTYLKNTSYRRGPPQLV